MKLRAPHICIRHTQLLPGFPLLREVSHHRAGILSLFSTMSNFTHGKTGRLRNPTLIYFSAVRPCTEESAVGTLLQTLLLQLLLTVLLTYSARPALGSVPSFHTGPRNVATKHWSLEKEFSFCDLQAGSYCYTSTHAPKIMYSCN